MDISHQDNKLIVEQPVLTRQLLALAAILVLLGCLLCHKALALPTPVMFFCALAAYGLLIYLVKIFGQKMILDKDAHRVDFHFVFLGYGQNVSYEIEGVCGCRLYASKVKDLEGGDYDKYMVILDLKDGQSFNLNPFTEHDKDCAQRLMQRVCEFYQIEGSADIEALSVKDFWAKHHQTLNGDLKPPQPLQVAVYILMLIPALYFGYLAFS